MITASLNMENWQKAARDLFGYQTRRNLQDFINGQALAVITRTMKLTKVANADVITRELEKTSGATYAVYKRGKNVGRINWGKVTKFYSPDSLVIRILAKRMRETGDWGVRGTNPSDDIQSVARKYIGRRRNSIAFIKSGWIPAVKELWAKTHTKPKNIDRFSFSKIMGVPKGGAAAAIFSWNKPVNAVAWNTALITSKDGRTSKPEPVALSALDQAFSIQTVDMVNHLKTLMEKEFRRTAHG